MINLIKMDLYRLFKTKSYYVMIVVTALLAIFAIFMLNEDILFQQSMQEKGNDNSKYEQEMLEKDNMTEVSSEGFTIGIYVETKEEWIYNKIDFADYLNVNFASNLVMILCVFVSIYVNGEQKNGYIKNIAGQLEKRSMLVLSKLVAVSVEVFSMLLVFVLISAISGKIAFGDKLICSSVISLLKLLGIEYVLHLATSSTVMAITLIFRSSGVGITYGLLDSMGLVASILGIINVFANKIFKFKDFDVLEYTVRGCITKLSVTFTTEVIIKSLIISIAFISISTILAMISMQKRDVK